ncbi:nuclear transport factor 2 family protein [Fluviicola sp.]|uniref:nuclear transport factor 2 family protein n=1 Tax=Fluviicola sp. TaxID=1917219 RepID=UPI0031DF3F5C
MNSEQFIADWLKAANAFDTSAFLDFWHTDAVLDDPSVGHVFKGHSGIRNYFEEYFIGYKTQTRLVKLETISSDEVHLEVEFTGEFPGGRIGGMFDLTFRGGKIAATKADLL